VRRLEVLSNVPQNGAVGGADSPQTVETVTFTPLRIQSRGAIAILREQAEECSLHIEAIEEQPRMLVTDLCLRVRGAPSAINSFCARTRGRRANDATGTKLRRLLGALWEAVSWNPPF
jgi:hypothetical protein